MKILLLLLAAVLTISTASAQDVIKPGQAKSYMGAEVYVRGKCVQVMENAKGEVYLNFGAKHPNQVFQGFVNKGDIKRLGGLKFLRSFEGKIVQIGGTMKEYKGSPRIIITDRSQLKIKG